MPWISENIHIYVERGQPMTRHVDNNFDPPHVTEYPDDKEFPCHVCGRRRPAKDLMIQVYYDGCHIYCRDKEYGRSPEFPFEYRDVCIGTAFVPRNQEQR